jgi:single-stranded-DNA-specific exonuclease
LPGERVAELRSRLALYASTHLEPSMLVKTVECHGLLPLSDISKEFHGWLRQLEPFGMGNPEPTFVARGVRLATSPRVMKQRHLRLSLTGGPDGRNISALGWHWAERGLQMGLAEGSVVNVAYHLRLNEHPDFGGLELEIVDLEAATAE